MGERTEPLYKEQKENKKKQKRRTSSTSASVGNFYYIVFVFSTATVFFNWDSASLSSGTSALDSESGSSDFEFYFKTESRGKAVDLFVRRAGVLDCRVNSPSVKDLRVNHRGWELSPHRVISMFSHLSH